MWQGDVRKIDDAQKIFDDHNALNDATGYYGKLLNVAKLINRSALIAHIPVTLAVEALIDDPATKKDILSILSAVETMSAAPLAAELGSASIKTFKESPSLGASATVVSKEVGRESLLQATPLIETIIRGLLS